MFLNIAFNTQLYRMIDTNMWALLVVVFGAVSLAQTNETTDFNQDFGPLHLNTKMGDLPEKQIPMKWEARRATRKAKTFVNYISTHRVLNPLKVWKPMGPYVVDIPDVKLFGNLTLENVVVSGMKDISIDNLEVCVTPPRIDFNFIVPQITAAGNFTLDAIFDEVPVHVYGNLSATLLELVVLGEIGPIRVPKQRGRLSMGSVYQLDSANVTIDLKALQVQMNMNQYANEFKLLFQTFFLHAEQVIEDNHLLRIILKGINQELEKISAKQFEKYLLGTAELGSKGRGWERDSKKNTLNSRKYGK